VDVDWRGIEPVGRVGDGRVIRSEESRGGERIIGKNDTFWMI
jgi:hypothetical protein